MIERLLRKIENPQVTVTSLKSEVIRVDTHLSSVHLSAPLGERNRDDAAYKELGKAFLLDLPATAVPGAFSLYIARGGFENTDPWVMSVGLASYAAINYLGAPRISQHIHKAVIAMLERKKIIEHQKSTK